ncbi:hypothetical protein ACYULU_03820 [Breznakiellaceae bacterium SP9]
MKKCFGLGLLIFTLAGVVSGESFRAILAGELELALNKEESARALYFNESALIKLGPDTRFFRGIEIELAAPQNWLPYHGSLALVLYSNVTLYPDYSDSSITDVEGKQLAFEVLPGKLRSIYQIPFADFHGIRQNPYADLLNAAAPSAFPLLLRLMPIAKGYNDELETLVFKLLVKPIVSNEGAVQIRYRYPEKLPQKPFVLLIDDKVVTDTSAALYLSEGEHHLLVLSEDYRNESRRFIVERSQDHEILIELKDPTPLLNFEAPKNALVYLDGTPVSNLLAPLPVRPGRHEVKFQVSDYLIIKNILVEKGKTYRVALSVDINIWENE